MALTESTMELELGIEAPDFALTDVVNGKTVKRDDFRGQKGLLVMFICAHCPYVKHIEKGLAWMDKHIGKVFGGGNQWHYYGLYGIERVPPTIMPMCIQWLGNNSVATIPTLFDLVKRFRVAGFELGAGDLVLFASVGAGMNINAMCYRCE